MIPTGSLVRIKNPKWALYGKIGIVIMLRDHDYIGILVSDGIVVWFFMNDLTLLSRIQDA